MIRLPGCQWEPCVLCHLQYPAGVRGMGQKAPDPLAAWGCFACHNEVDRRTHHFDIDYARLAMYEGVIRTLQTLIAEGKLRW